MSRSRAAGSTVRNHDEDGVPAEEPVPPRSRRDWFGPSVVAVVTWLVATPVLLYLERTNALNPMDVRGGFIPLATGCVLLAVMIAAACVPRAGERVAAVGAGLFGAWVAFALQVALNGSPFGFAGLIGDMARMSAAATRMTVVPWPTDSFIDEIPSEYPPLFPWLIGRASVVFNRPAWQLLPTAEVLLMSFAVVAAFLMWRRLVPAPAALVVSGLGLFVYGSPQKAFAVITLFVFVPWVIAAFAQPARGRLHWLPAGLIGGLIMLTYNGWFPFGLVGVLAILVASWRRSENRKGYVWHVVGVGVVTLAVAAPYLVPYFSAVLTRTGQALGDLFISTQILDNGFPFFQFSVIGALELIGLAGVVFYRRRFTWAWSLLYLVLGSYVFWLVMGIRFIFSGHTTLIYYVPWLSGMSLVAGGVLTLVQAVPALVRRARLVPPRRVGVAALAVAMLWISFTYWEDWRPRPGLVGSPKSEFTYDMSTRAHLEPLPNCTYPTFAPVKGRRGCLPVKEIENVVARVRGTTDDRPVTMSVDERLFSYLPWRGYMGTDRTSASSLARWDDRHQEIVTLSGIEDPDEFTEASANTAFGPIDVFVFSRSYKDDWAVTGRYFLRVQFDPAVWHVEEDLEKPYVVAVRRP